MARIRDL